MRRSRAGTFQASFRTVRSLDDLHPRHTALGIGLLALLYRAYLTTIYWGHEEEDWGNLQVIQGILGDPFGPTETEHMPLFTWLAALSSALTGDPQIGAEAVAVLCGAGVVAVTTWVGMRWFSPATGILAGLFLCFQPESALYSATPLRESLFTLTMISGVALIGSRHMLGGATLLALAFLARFNIAFSILPALVLWVGMNWRSRSDDSTGQASRIRSLIAIGVVTGTVAAWAYFYHSTQGTWNFWVGVMDRNTGNAVTDLFVGERIRASFGAVFGLSCMVLPTHVGWALVPLAILGGVQRAASPTKDNHAVTWFTLCGASTLALLLGTALLSTYEWQHNLYWKWLTPTVPYFCILGVHGATVGLRLLLQHPLLGAPLLRAIPGPAIWGIATVLFASLTLSGYATETQRQVQMSTLTYGTQVRLAAWLEESWPEESTVLTWVYSIPAAYLQRNLLHPKILDWHDPELPSDSPADLGAWLLREQVGLVIWYSEEGTGGRNAAAYLESGETQQLGPVRLEPLVHESTYGMLAYLVVGDGIPTPEVLPSAAWFMGGTE